MKYLISIVILTTLFLSSCGKAPDTTGSGTVIEVVKTPFVLKTQKLSEFSREVETQKSGRISASSNLTLTSKGAGEIGKILVKEGQYVKAGATIAILRDTVNNFDLRLDQAENALIQQNASIATTEANMNNSIDAARIGLSRAQLAYKSATDRKNIQQLTLTTTNLRTIESYNILYKNYLSDLERQMTQMLYGGDKILGITTAYEGLNDAWEDYLGVRIGDSKALATNEWNKTYGTRGDLRSRIQKGIYITAGTANTDLSYITDNYDQLVKFADAMIYMIQNNVIGAGLSPEMQSAWVAEWNGIRAQIQASLSGYSAWRSQVLGFLKTYEGTEKATELAIASMNRPLTTEEEAILAGSNDMRVTYETTRLALRDSLENARLTLEQAQSTYDNAVKIKNATLSQLGAARENANIALAQARRDYAKLSISAPVEGAVTKLRTSVGETINIGSPIAEFSGKKPEIVLDIDQDLAKNLSVADSVVLEVEDMTLRGTITALSTIGGANFLSTVRISVQDGEKYIGKSVNVIFQTVGSIRNNTVFLPLDAVKIISEGEGEVAVLTTDKTIIKKPVSILNIGGSNVELTGEFSSGEVIISNDISNYDPLKNTLTIE